MGHASDVLQNEPHLASHQGDEVKRRRLRWRARRGLLENDLVLGRFFDKYESNLSDDDVQGLDELLELGDNDLLDLIFNRASEDKEKSLPVQAWRVLKLLRQV